MNVVSILLGLILVSNIFFAGIVIFRERREAESAWAWLLVLFFMPVLGFALYLLLGRERLRRLRLFEWEDLNKLGLKEQLKEQSGRIRKGTYPFRNPEAARHRDLVLMHLARNQSLLTENNEVDIFTDGKTLYDRLFRDIEEAKDYIHLQTYILRNDRLGRRLMALLTEKAKQGVTVRLLYDELGSRKLTGRFFREFRAAGGQAEAFFPSRVGISRLINLRINYRNHRKLAVIDGVIGYVGGFNIGDEYLGLNSRFGYWRDTHLRIRGEAVYALQTRFILDWNQASHRHDIAYTPNLYPEPVRTGRVGIQVVTSGPVSRAEHIKNGFLRMIASARKSIHIQTPYFIPDSSVLDMLQVAAASGVDVHIMIPDKPDHPFVYWATMYHVGEMLRAGANVYLYRNGFLHAKTIIVDGEIASVGTANMDNRSFRLNFEVNAFLYDCSVARRLLETFREDLNVSEPLTWERYRERPLRIRFKESVCRLLSPIL